MEVRIASRKSALARIQSYLVAAGLRAAHPGLRVSFHFSESLGDKNLEDPLWKMPEKGVFTMDLQQDLLAGRCDVVVHSWKDLPVEAHPETVIAATLPRADVRDVLLLRRDALNAKPARVKILSSSPRRAYNLGALLPELLPWTVAAADFASVRGNVSTRIRKLLEGDAHGIVLAKAGLDRLLAPPGGTGDVDLDETAAHLSSMLARCVPMVLPVSRNPAAPAQGALALEIRADRADLHSLLAKVHCAGTYERVQEERSILKLHGGGCHQKIGATRLPHPLGELLAVRGLTEGGLELRQWNFIAQSASSGRRAEAWPLDPKDAVFFEREATGVARPQGYDAFFVARADAWPLQWERRSGDLLWTSGLDTWKKLAKAGILVNGSAEGLGENGAFVALEPLFGRRHWLKLSHEAGVPAEVPTLATYRLRPRSDGPRSWVGKKTFYWMSASAFEAACSLDPSIRTARHACGPGHTFGRLTELLGPSETVSVFLDHAAWLASLSE
jgi:hydroxymethylbilane synthase